MALRKSAEEVLISCRDSKSLSISRFTSPRSDLFAITSVPPAQPSPLSALDWVTTTSEPELALGFTSMTSPATRSVTNTAVLLVSVPTLLDPELSLHLLAYNLNRMIIGSSKQRG